jgi:hypothetical protein
LKGRRIFLHPSFPKGEEAKPSIEFSKSSPPFEKGRTGGISGKAFSKHERVTKNLLSTLLPAGF